MQAWTSPTLVSWIAIFHIYIYLAYVILYICKAACDVSEWHLAMQAWLTADSVMKLSESHLAMWVWHTADSEILVEARASNNIFQVLTMKFAGCWLTSYSHTCNAWTCDLKTTSLLTMLTVTAKWLYKPIQVHIRSICHSNKHTQTNITVPHY